ncbi:hypothetical protein [Paenibacillus oleatilyticus]|uniref:hypothetical protein n=1 Tax=Paenibacillus oleatilyticus TaxID=2594886 RepID=UPI001C1F9DB5|nr:hypothetical protein [Paenibacillus oleatilyticus]MBU7316000.1 hypothetical protein [Paenibacillus oleatilyticus]
MECNNQYCYWNYEMHCCPESEKAYNNAVPDTLDCPSSLRKDFEEQLYILHNECVQLLNKRNMKELREIKKFIESQRQ